LDKQKGGRRTLVGGGAFNAGFSERGNTREDSMDVDEAMVENKGKNRK
jgi:hypothetical protein